jgi:hypothetical protein
MHLRRSVILGATILGLGLFTLDSLPVRAQEGELVAEDTQAQINLRSLANTQADIVAAGAVGERAQILGYSNAEDGLLWYRVKLLKTGQVGWVRGDLIKVFGATKPKSGKSSQVTAAKSTPVPLSPPKTSASIKSAAPTKAASSKPASKSAKSVAEPKVSEPKAVDAPKANDAPLTEPTVTPPTESNDPTTSSTIVSFQTPSYAVRVFSQSGQLRLNLFNRKTNRIALRAAPVQSKSSGEGTTYSYLTNDLQVNVAVPETGQPTLTAIALGDTLKEQPEAAAQPTTAPEESQAPVPTAPQ